MKNANSYHENGPTMNPYNRDIFHPDQRPVPVDIAFQVIKT